MFIQVLYNDDNSNNNDNSIHNNNNENLAADNPSDGVYCLRFLVLNDIWNVDFWVGKDNWRILRKNTEQGRETTETHS